MISLATIFWAMVLFFGLIGLLRGWTREVIATSGLVLSMFALNLASNTNVIRFIVADPANYQVLGNPALVEAYNRADDPNYIPDPALQAQLAADPSIGEAIAGLRREFYILAIIHMGIAFFSYQGPTLAGRVVGDRLRVRDSVQDKMLGAIIGAINGYLIFGTLWNFLEYRVTLPDMPRLTQGFNYAFFPSIERPAAAMSMQILDLLPLAVLGPFLPFVVVGMFLFVIIVMI
jgi:hypothetical protein